MSTSDKKSAALLADIFCRKGLKYIVISPGSRNAPLIISFAGNSAFEPLSIFDERSAAFFALGLAQQTRKAVAIACTSGTAALNYAPAIAEAYYQQVPLLILTADRPADQIDQGDGQTIRQKNIFRNYVKASFELQENFSSEHDFRRAERILHRAIDLTMAPAAGPVHINLPFSEPIYSQVENHSWTLKYSSPVKKISGFSEADAAPYIRSWKKYSKKLVIAGLSPPDPALAIQLQRITGDPGVRLLSETTSNISGCTACTCIDKIVSTIRPEESENFRPELLLTFGGHVVSKMIKTFIRNNQPAAHWHIDPAGYPMNTYGCLSSVIKAIPEQFFSFMQSQTLKTGFGYSGAWADRDQRSEERHIRFLRDAPYSDLKVFEIILQHIPENSSLHLGNSTPVRYAQLFKPFRKLAYFSNRGVSGIDGTVSTAAGAAWATRKITTLITGDLGFFYDSNGLFHDYLENRLKIIVINNSGGGIFRFIPGPDSTPHLEKFFEARHHRNARFIAKAAGIEYFSAGNMTELSTELKNLYNTSSPAILEVHTPGETNGEILRNYFKYLAE
ncbi:MAG: 2-succinyl-5-enolpyruvyl-6-hydroxy-3-cyclohexene-1-carboxylic-acid synthase [Bacteroidales bacterium]|nr:2-succinyl-5-enolpyruvyl-6-hydroxy-3-cyclohexene-1-carboxylic-acid synthase [Bacteroidales bacterium]